MSLIAVLPALKKKYLWCIGLAILAVPISIWASNLIFDGWWQELNEIKKNEEDMRWIADHDGGIVIVRFMNFVKAALFSFLSIVVMTLLWFKHSRKRANQSQVATP